MHYKMNLGHLSEVPPTPFGPFLATSSWQSVTSSGDLSIVSNSHSRLLCIKSIKPGMSHSVFER